MKTRSSLVLSRWHNCSLSPVRLTTDNIDLEIILANLWLMFRLKSKPLKQPNALKDGMFIPVQLYYYFVVSDVLVSLAGVTHNLQISGAHANRFSFPTRMAWW